MGLDKEIRRRIKRAMGDFEQAVEIFDAVLPALKRGIESDEFAIRLADEISRYLKSRKEEEQVMVGKMEEVVPILRTAKYEFRNLITLEEYRDEFIRADVNTIKGILEILDRKIRQDALVLLSDEEFRAYQDDLIEAEKRRKIIE